MNYQFEQISAEKVVLKGSFNEWLIISITFHPYHGELSNVFQGNIFLIRMPPNKKEAVRTPKKTVFCGTASCYRLSRSSIITKTKHFIINNCHILANGQLYKNRWSMNAFKSTRFSQKIMLYNMNSSWSRWCSRI